MPGSENQDLPDVREVPVLPLKDAVLFPHAMRPFQVDHPSAVRLIEEMGSSLEHAAVVTVREEPATDEEALNLHEIGCLARVLKVISMPGGDPRSFVLFAQGIRRVRVTNVVSREPHLRVRVEPLDDVLPAVPDDVFQALPATSGICSRKSCCVRPIYPTTSCPCWRASKSQEPLPISLHRHCRRSRRRSARPCWKRSMCRAVSKC